MKPCPFCGAEAELKSLDGELPGPWVVVCTNRDNCGAMMTAFAHAGSRDTQDIRAEIKRRVLEQWGLRAETDEDFDRRLTEIETANPEDL